MFLSHDTYWTCGYKPGFVMVVSPHDKKVLSPKVAIGERQREFFSGTDSFTLVRVV